MSKAKCQIMVWSKKKYYKRVPLLFNLEENNFRNKKITEERVKIQIENVYDAYNVFWYNWNHLTIGRVESYMTLFLKKTKGYYGIVGLSLESVGTNNECTIIPDRIIQRAKSVDSEYIITAHNHTNISTQPSFADIEGEIFLAKKAKVNEVKLLEHIILVPKRRCFFSFVKARIF